MHQVELQVGNTQVQGIDKAAHQGVKACLQLRRQQLEDVVDLVLKPTRKHLVSLVQDEHPDGVSPQGATAQHIVDAARRAHDDVHSSLKDACVLAHGGTTHTGVTLDLQGASPLFNTLFMGKIGQTRLDAITTWLRTISMICLRMQRCNDRADKVQALDSSSTCW